MKVNSLQRFSKNFEIGSIPETQLNVLSRFAPPPPPPKKKKKIVKKSTPKQYLMLPHYNGQKLNLETTKLSTNTFFDSECK